MVGQSAGLVTEVSALEMPCAVVTTLLCLLLVVTSCALEKGRGVLGRLGMAPARDLGTGSVGSETAMADLPLLSLVAGFCSSNTGWAFLTLSGGKGCVGS